MSLVLIVVLLTVGWLLYQTYLKNLLAQGQAGQFKLAMIVLGVIFLAMAVTGRAPALFAIIGAAMTQVIRLAPLLIRFAPFLKRYLGTGLAGAAGQASAGGESKVATSTIVMSLNHTTGGMSGDVLSGPLVGRTLASLSVTELHELYRYCQANDYDALRLLENYVTRERATEWNASGGSQDTNQGSTGKTAAGARAMGVEEARQILGLEGQQLSRDAIVSAHRSLMGRFHPDKGGNDYLATKINSARSVLLETLPG